MIKCCATFCFPYLPVFHKDDKKRELSALFLIISYQIGNADILCFFLAHFALSDLCKLCKSLCIIYSEVSEYLAVKLDISLLKAIHKLAV